MSDKCEWKDGKFEGCELATFRLKNYGWKWANLGEYKVIKYRDDFYDYCPFCGADIRKPEEKPLIVKSGGTFAAHWKGVDYLWTTLNRKPLSLDPLVRNNYLYYPGTVQGKLSGWKPFSEIEKEGLTDELAKLRPMIVDLEGNFKPEILYGVLYGVTPDKIGILDFCNRNIKNLRLATPHELQEK